MVIANQMESEQKNAREVPCSRVLDNPMQVGVLDLDFWSEE